MELTEALIYNLNEGKIWNGIKGFLKGWSGNQNNSFSMQGLNSRLKSGVSGALSANDNQQQTQQAAAPQQVAPQQQTQSGSIPLTPELQADLQQLQQILPAVKQHEIQANRTAKTTTAQATKIAKQQTGNTLGGAVGRGLQKVTNAAAASTNADLNFKGQMAAGSNEVLKAQKLAASTIIDRYAYLNRLQEAVSQSDQLLKVVNQALQTKQVPNNLVQQLQFLKNSGAEYVKGFSKTLQSLQNHITNASGQSELSEDELQDLKNLKAALTKTVDTKNKNFLGAETQQQETPEQGQTNGQ